MSYFFLISQVYIFNICKKNEFLFGYLKNKNFLLCKEDVTHFEYFMVNME